MLLPGDFDPFSKAELLGDTLTLTHGDSTSEVDLLTGEVTTTDDKSTSEPTSQRKPVVAVFDAARQRLLWTEDAADLTTIAVVGDLIVISTLGRKG